MVGVGTQKASRPYTRVSHEREEETVVDNLVVAKPRRVVHLHAARICNEQQVSEVNVSVMVCALGKKKQCDAIPTSTQP